MIHLLFSRSFSLVLRLETEFCFMAYARAFVVPTSTEIYLARVMSVYMRLRWIMTKCFIVTGITATVNSGQVARVNVIVIIYHHVINVIFSDSLYS